MPRRKFPKAAARTASSGLLLATVLLTQLSGARAEPDIPKQTNLPPGLFSQARPNDTVEKVRARALREFLKTDIDGGGVSASDYELKRRMEMAKRRSGLISSLLSQDLNGDGRIDRQELRAYHSWRAHQNIRLDNAASLPPDDHIEQTINTQVNRSLYIDADRNGAIDFPEILAWSNSRMSSQQIYVVRQDIPISLDEDGDGVVSESEFIRAVNRHLAAYDLDRDGKFSSFELGLMQRNASAHERAMHLERKRRQAEAELRASSHTCLFPKAPSGARIVLASIYGGEALSTVGLGDEDHKVEVADVVIEPGERPLYVILISQSAIIWRLSGSVHRVAYLVAGSNQRRDQHLPHVGVTGLPAANVYLAPNSDCLRYFTSHGTDSAKRMVRLVPSWAGRPADDVITNEYASKISVPSGKIELSVKYPNSIEPPKSPNAATVWAGLQSFFPGGVVRIDAANVVSRLPVTPYTILPAEAGLAHLVQSGALRVIDTKRTFTFGRATFVLGKGEQVSVQKTIRHRLADVPSKFLILKKFHYPAGLGWIEFVLAPGVERPEGDPGSSRIVAR